MIVVDASVVIEVLLLTPRGLPIAHRILVPDTPLAAPEVLDLEVAQVFRRLVRSSELSEVRAEQALQDLSDLRLTRYSHQKLIPRIWRLRENLTAYDGAYIALAEALDATLLTGDRRLSRAPHGARIEVV